MRVRYINKAERKEIDKTSVPAYLKSLYQDFPFADELFEIHILRDVLAHNHLLEISHSWSDEGGMIVDSIDKRSSGDNKYQQYVDPVTNVAKKLRLNISPIRVGGIDAILVVKTMWNILIFLERKNRNQCYASHLSAIHKGKNTKFGEIVGLPETCT